MHLRFRQFRRVSQLMTQPASRSCTFRRATLDTVQAAVIPARERQEGEGRQIENLADPKSILVIDLGIGV
jgi:hypothetical protein